MEINKGGNEIDRRILPQVLYAAIANGDLENLGAIIKVGLQLGLPMPSIYNDLVATFRGRVELPPFADLMAGKKGKPAKA